MNISEKIQILRRDKEWSQDELAEKLNVSRQSVSKWESGKALPDSEKILAMANLFDVSTDFLLKDEQEPVFVDDEKEQTKDKTDGALTENTEKKKHKPSGKKIVAIVVVACIVI
ncbi:MAG: helix-turn-helix transcriptional regulator, partial [Acutalibacteraceae bacterium]|nr:helix-turn-helix transcriptional regulator [Acutalibacteraceae bacterium]